MKIASAIAVTAILSTFGAQTMTPAAAGEQVEGTNRRF
jgi:hypothetical protein